MHLPGISSLLRGGGSSVEPRPEAWRPVSCLVLLPAVGSPSMESSAAYRRGCGQPLRISAQVFSEALTGCRAHCCCSFKTLARIRIKGLLKTPHYLPLSLEGCLWGGGSSPVTTSRALPAGSRWGPGLWPEARLPIPVGDPVNMLGTLASHCLHGSLRQTCPGVNVVP